MVEYCRWVASSFVIKMLWTGPEFLTLPAPIDLRWQMSPAKLPRGFAHIAETERFEEGGLAAVDAVVG